MVYGDMGGPVTTLILTCRAAAQVGGVLIRKGDAVKLSGTYEVTNKMIDGDSIFGEALEDCTEAGTTLAVRVRGVCTFPFVGDMTVPDGKSGVVASAERGKVRPQLHPTGQGLIVRVREDQELVEVLL